MKKWATMLLPAVGGLMLSCAGGCQIASPGSRSEIATIFPVKSGEPLPPLAPPAGFTPLFDGRTLNGWQGLIDGGPPAKAKLTPLQRTVAQQKADETMRSHWSIDPATPSTVGILFFDGKGESLCTINDYADFDLIIEWMIPPGGDSGVYVRGSPQIQIWDSAVGSGGLYNNLANDSVPSSNADFKAGRWNRFYIQMRSERVWVWLNGELVTDGVVMENYWERSKPIYPSGPIELQAHGGPLWFRNVWIRER